LDDFYEIQLESETGVYTLTRREDIGPSLPDSMLLRLDSSLSRIGGLQYLDTNEDLNRLEFLSQEFMTRCEDNALEPSFPDTVEVIRLF
jgi:hypothetical protein